nr:CDP-glycerol glycerophosphotransferase family protein [Nitrosomonas nitrosa]
MRRPSQSLLAAGRESGRLLRTAAAVAWINARPSTAAAIRERKLWLLGGSVGAAYSDNGAALHHHLLSEHPEIETFWIINRGSRDIEKASTVGPVLFRNDLMTTVCALLAQVHVISHGVHDVPTSDSRLTSAFRVRVGHGLTALKRTKPRGLHSNASANANFDLVTVSSPFEKRIKEREWGIPKEKLAVTGLPRFDPLLRKHRASKANAAVGRPSPRRLLYMPTWRDWLPTTARGISSSPFFCAMKDLLTSQRLRNVLERHDAYIDISTHIGMRAVLLPLLQRLASDRIALVNALDMQDALVASVALITDYSSLAWDALYIDKPVLFLPFDLEEYQRNRGAYFDLRHELPGPVAWEARTALTLIEKHLDGSIPTATYEAHAQAWKERVFPFRDDKNSERVTQAILAGLQDSAKTPHRTTRRGLFNFKH